VANDSLKVVVPYCSLSHTDQDIWEEGVLYYSHSHTEEVACCPYAKAGIGCPSVEGHNPCYHIDLLDLGRTLL
jgi:hypothetical protein